MVVVSVVVATVKVAAVVIAVTVVMVARVGSGRRREHKREHGQGGYEKFHRRESSAGHGLSLRNCTWA